ncbi:unnamed protein product [Caenorhabditis brenneri]
MAPIDNDAPLSAAIKRNKTGNKFKSSPKNKFSKNFVEKSNIAKPSEGSKKMTYQCKSTSQISLQHLIFQNSDSRLNTALNNSR